MYRSFSDRQTRRTRGISLQILPWDFLKGGRQEDEEQSVSDRQTRGTRGISLQILPWDYIKGGRQEDEEQLAVWSCLLGLHCTRMKDTFRTRVPVDITYTFCVTPAYKRRMPDK